MISEKPTPYLLIKCSTTNEYDECGGYAFVHLDKELLDDLPFLRNNLELLQANFIGINSITLSSYFDILKHNEVAEIEQHTEYILENDWYYLTDFYESRDELRIENEIMHINEWGVYWEGFGKYCGNYYSTNWIMWEVLEAILKNVDKPTI